ncbi:hypothetical protein RDI58_019927 [Solanum bulbocastanum]|uniref:Uncharacterized protein n=1 Tax=Solanum bulbocastanum TaxID=147425 RepID=A0AAN8TB45_SOLBU
MALCDHQIFGSGMPYNDPWPCNETNVVRQFRLRVVDEKLMAKVRTTVGVENPLYPMDRKSEEKSHDLHLAWCDETFQLKFGIKMLKANTREGIKRDIEDVLCLCD